MALALKDVIARYPGEDSRNVLKGVTLSVGETGCSAIVGPSGSGKSTIGRVMNGLLKPLEGSVELNDKEIHQLPSLAEARRRIGLLMQQPDNQLFGVTVGEDIRFGPLQAGLDPSTAEERMVKALARVGLNHRQFVARSPFSLSGGERRRVALAGLLAMRPEYLVLDEPVAGLDPAGRESIEMVIADTSKDLGVILLTADLPLALRLADRVILIEDGVVLFDGTPSAALEDRERLVRLRLIVPVQAEVLSLLEARGAPIKPTVDLRPRTVVAAITSALRTSPAGLG
jgi:energy-coupling factor transporter ATP-binding protein EcfA2